MKIIIRTIAWCILLSGSFSCTIQKRVYMSGYYVEWLSFRKTKPDPLKYKFTGYSLNAYNALSTKPSQETMIDAGNPEAIYCKEGTVIRFPDNAFVYEDGGSVKCTQVAVYVTEFYTMSDIIEAGLTTSDNKRTLASAGMVYIEARCHGEKLKLKHGKSVTIKMPAIESDNKMKSFSGKLKDGIVDWSLNGSLKLANSEPEENAPLGDYDGPVESFRVEGRGEYEETYLMSMTKLGWINCDRFYDTKNPVKLLVKADSVEKTFVALIFRDMKSVLPGNQFANFTTEFTGIPSGQAATILAYRINEKTKEAIVGQQEVVLGDTNVVQLSMQSMELRDFKSMLTQFN